jgi:hypothetical protein
MPNGNRRAIRHHGDDAEQNGGGIVPVDGKGDGKPLDDRKRQRILIDIDPPHADMIRTDGDVDVLIGKANKRNKARKEWKRSEEQEQGEIVYRPKTRASDAP